MLAWAYDLKPMWGGTKFLPEKFVTAMTSPKKKKRSSPVSLHRFHYFWPKYTIKRVSKQVLTFFFCRCYCSDKFFGKNVRTLTQIARKIKSCPKFLQPGGASALPDPPLRTPMFVGLVYMQCCKPVGAKFCFKLDGKLG